MPLPKRVQISSPATRSNTVAATRRHCTVKRIEKLLTDLDQPLENADDTLTEERLDLDT